MITVSFPKVVTNRFHFTVLGHSSEHKGYDIVCASVSTLVQTYLRGLERNLNAEFVGNFQAGNCDLEITIPENKVNEFKIISEVFRDGFRDIAVAYPEQVKLI